MNANWKKIWLRKGAEDTEDLCVLNGYEKVNEKTSFRESAVCIADNICKTMGINKDSRTLEVGCGAGMLAQHFDCDYVGVDYSESLIQKHRNILGNNVVLSEASSLPFEDKSFDFVFSYGVFHYFSDKEYVNKSIAEMKRVAKRAIFIGDLPINSFRADHLLFSHKEFEDWEISSAFYDRTDGAARFNVLKALE